MSCGQTCGLFRKVALEVAEEFPDIAAEEMLVDTCAMELVRDPGQFEVLVTTNLFGDILSDEASMLVGGLGMACSGNIGEGTAIFEPVHGSAPRLAGTGIKPTRWLPSFQRRCCWSILASRKRPCHPASGGWAARRPIS